MRASWPRPDAFSAAAAANNNSDSIQPGYYRLRKSMSAASALTLLLDPSSLVNTTVPIPEGLIEKEIVAKLATALGRQHAAVQKAADRCRRPRARRLCPGDGVADVASKVSCSRLRTSSARA